MHPNPLKPAMIRDARFIPQVFEALPGLLRAWDQGQSVAMSSQPSLPAAVLQGRRQRRAGGFDAAGQSDRNVHPRSKQPRLAIATETALAGRSARAALGLLVSEAATLS